MSEDMIKRGARAMAEAAGFAWENCAQSQWCRDFAAGIAAIREPTEAMLDAGGHASPPDGPYADGPAWIRNRWRAMIDAALKSHAKPA